MLQRSVHVLATLGALAALLVGLGRHWEFWAIVKRAVTAYLALYLAGGSLFVLARLALDRSDEPSTETARQGREGRGTGGTNTAI